MIFIKQKIKQAFQCVKLDIIQTRKKLTDGLFSLTTEYAKLQLRIQNLERRIEELESNKTHLHEQSYDYAHSY